MADTKVYAGKEGIKELWRRIKAEIGKFTAFQKKPAAPDGTPDVPLADRKTNIIYLVEDPTAPSPDHYKEWIWTLPEGSEGEWVRIGDTSMDLSDMARKSEMSVESVQGDPTKATIQLNTNLVQEVVVEHQDISGKQDVISDLASIRTGAAAGTTAYQKPNTGIPSSDMTATVQASLGLADSAVQPAALATKQDKPSSSTAGNIATFDSGSSTVDSGKAFLNSTGTWDGTSDSLVPTAKSIQSKLNEKFGDLATVATTGSYEDLSNTPTIPVVPESTTVIIDSTTYLRSYDGHPVYAARTDCDKDGNDLTLGIDGTTNTVTDNSGEPVQDSSGNPLADAESDARVVSIGELPIWADRAEKDASGNDIEATYATKQELEDALGDLETILASI